MSKLVLVTPEIAEMLLKNNHPLNALRRKKYGYLKAVEEHVTNMKSGHFKSNAGIPIALSKTGTLLNGQHRLDAIIIYGKPVFMHIVDDLDDSDYSNFDNGKIRTASDNTGIPRKYTTVINQAVQISTANSAKKLTNNQYFDLYYGNFGHYAQRVLESKSTKVRILGDAGFNVAATVILSRDKDDFVLEFRKNLTAIKTSELPPLGVFVCEQLAKHGQGSNSSIFAKNRIGSTTSENSFLLGMYIFDRKNWYKKQVNLSLDHKEKCIAELKKLLSD